MSYEYFGCIEQIGQSRLYEMHRTNDQQTYGYSTVSIVTNRTLSADTIETPFIIWVFGKGVRLIRTYF